MTANVQCRLIVTAEVDAEVEAEWSRWYDEVHLPDALACPGVLSGVRYVSAGPIGENDRGSRTKSAARLYTTIYELSDTGAVETEALARLTWYSTSSLVGSSGDLIAARTIRSMSE